MPSAYFLYVCGADVKYFCEIIYMVPSAGFHRIIFLNNPYLKGVEFCDGTFFSVLIGSITQSIAGILRWGLPRKIMNGIVRDTILTVTSKHSFWSWTYEGFKNKLVNHSVEFLSIFFKREFFVASSVNRWLHFLRNSRRSTVRTNSFCRVDISDFIGKVIRKVGNGFYHICSKMKLPLSLLAYPNTVRRIGNKSRGNNKLCFDVWISTYNLVNY